MAKKQEVGKGRTQVKDLPPKKRDLNKAEQKRIKGGIAPLTRGIMPQGDPDPDANNHFG